MIHHVHQTLCRRLAAALGVVFCLAIFALSSTRATADAGSLAGHLAALPRRLTFTFQATAPQIVAA